MTGPGGDRRRPVFRERHGTLLGDGGRVRARSRELNTTDGGSGASIRVIVRIRTIRKRRPANLCRTRNRTPAVVQTPGRRMTPGQRAIRTLRRMRARGRSPKTVSRRVTKMATVGPIVMTAIASRRPPAWNPSSWIAEMGSTMTSTGAETVKTQTASSTWCVGFRRLKSAATGWTMT